MVAIATVSGAARKPTTLKKNQDKSVAEKPRKPSSGGMGGRREGAGRKKGSPNKKTRATVAAIEASGKTPLQFMLEVMRNEAVPEDADPATRAAYVGLRFEAAKAAAPYVHARLASVEVAGKNGGPIKTENVSIPIDPVEAAKVYKEILGG